MISHQPIFDPRARGILHGADYNPDQWLHMPHIIDEDFALMKRAGANIMNVGIFAWAALEPREGEFRFEWLDDILDRLAEINAFACLATPSGSRPQWLSIAYPETSRVGPNRVRNLPGRRHNHNYSSPVMMEKVTIMNTKLAERYKDHPALLVWHVSNEYGGEDHSELSQQAFRLWLRKRYNDDLDALNRAWWTAFWSHSYRDWSEIESPAPHGETSLHGLVIDWKRFVTHQTIEFMKVEIEPLRRLTPDVPITTNFMGTYPGLDYFKFSSIVDVVSWDSYPQWHAPYDHGATGRSAEAENDYRRAADVAFAHDLMRSIKRGRPFMLMESTPSVTNWQPVAKLKRPGVHILSSLQAVAHGADTIEYFQWRKSRGSSEKFHGAVVDHVGHGETRVFAEVAELGEILKKLERVAGSTVPASVAIVFDWECRWALDESQGPRNDGRTAYVETVMNHYRAFHKAGVPVDIVDGDGSIDGYRIVVAPMMYMVKPGFADRVRAHVEAGGAFVATYWSGIVDETDLCFLGGFPGPLRSILGVWSEEIDALYPGETNGVVFRDGNSVDLSGRYTGYELCDLIHAETAEVLATYESDFYAGRPAVTCNTVGAGKAYYIAARMEEEFLDALYGRLIDLLDVPCAISSTLPHGVVASVRRGAESSFIFVQNYTPSRKTVDLPDETRFVDMLTGEKPGAKIELEAYGVSVLRTEN